MTPMEVNNLIRSTRATLDLTVGTPSSLWLGVGVRLGVGMGEGGGNQGLGGTDSSETSANNMSSPQSILIYYVMKLWPSQTPRWPSLTVVKSSVRLRGG